jgi:hypothetical protein
MKVVMHDTPILRTVLAIARVCPSSIAHEELNEGQNSHKYGSLENKIYTKLNLLNIIF